MEEAVLFSVEKQTAVITLNRPERRNAINQALLAKLYDAIEKVTTDTNIRVAIITGNGKSFSSSDHPESPQCAIRIQPPRFAPKL